MRLCIECEGSAADASSYGHAVTSTASFASGAVGLGCEVGAATSCVVPDADTLDPTEITFELFARVDTVPTSGRSGLIDKNVAWGLFVYPGGDVRCTGGGPEIWARGVVSAGVWTHYACTWNASEGRLYVNGTLAASGTGGAVAASTATINIAEDSDDGDDQLGGAIDELRIFGTARSPAEISAAAAR